MRGQRGAGRGGAIVAPSAAVLALQAALRRAVSGNATHTRRDTKARPGRSGVAARVARSDDACYSGLAVIFRGLLDT